MISGDLWLLTWQLISALTINNSTANLKSSFRGNDCAFCGPTLVSFALRLAPYLYFLTRETKNVHPNFIIFPQEHLLPYLRTELSPSWEAANCADNQKIPKQF
jgi:hypothetical protein